MSHEDDHIVSALVNICREFGTTCLIQVGAEDGYEANRIREATGCRAIAFDGDPKCEPCSPALEWHRLLIGATDCVMDFYSHNSLGLSSQFTRKDGHENLIQVPQVRLDTFCRENSISPDALIVDTEGTTLDVLEGCGDLIDGLKIVYAETQSSIIRPGMRLVGEVDALLVAHGMTMHQGLPSYCGGAQSNTTWVRK